jgi:hypothetical protein
MQRLTATFLSLVLSFLLPVNDALQNQKKAVPKARCEGCALGSVTLSDAVVSSAFRDLRELHNQTRAGTVRSEHVQAVITSLHTFFDHLDETGATKIIEDNIALHREELLRFEPTQEHILAVQAKYKSFGILASEETIQRTLTTPVGQRDRALEILASEGLHGLRDRYLASLKEYHAKLVKWESIGNGEMRTIHLTPCDHYELIAAMMGIACAFGCLGCCVVGAVAALFSTLCRMTGGLV